MDPTRFYLLARTYYGFAWTLMTTVSMVYMWQHAQLDPLQMVLVGTALEVSAFLFEIPTGVVADTVSRKLSVVIGHLLVGASFVLLALVPEFWVIVISQVFLGLGWTFISGAYTAWITDEVGVVRGNQAVVRAAQWTQVSAFVGIAGSVALAHIWLPLPILISGVMIMALGVVMQIVMRETRFEPLDAGDVETWQTMRSTFLAGVGEVRAQPVLLTIMAIAVIYGLFSEGIDRLFVPLVIDEFELPAIGALDAITWWGVIYGVSRLTGMLAMWLVRRYVALDDHVALARVLSWMTVVIALGVVCVANVEGLAVVLVAYWLLMGTREALDPLTTAWLNRLIPNRARATLLSMYGQADAVGQTMSGPVIGLMAKYVGIGFALTVSALILLPALWLYRIAAGQPLRAERADNDA